MDFTRAIDPEQYAYVTLNGLPIRVNRRRFGGHIQLLSIANELQTCDDGLMAASWLIRYLIVAGVDEQIIKQATPMELYRAFFILSQLNGWAWIIPLIDPKRADGRPSEKPPYDYAGRRWAIWIHRIAQAYGWSRDDILNLWPEEAAVYMQEIAVSDYFDKEERRALHEISYRLDKGSNTRHFVPWPKPAWMVDPEPKKVRIKRSALPVGNVIGKETPVQ